MNFRLLTNKHGGKPHALLCGIKKARGKYMLFTDMDQSTPIDQLEKLLPFLAKKYEVVIGSRGMDRKKFPIYRKLGSMVFIQFRKALLLRDINDTQCGFKLFNTEIVKSAFPKLEFFRNKQKVKGWKVTSYDVELLHIIKKMGYKIKEVTVNWSQEDESDSKGNSLTKYINESQEMLMQIIRVKYNDLRKLYD